MEGGAVIISIVLYLLFIRGCHGNVDCIYRFNNVSCLFDVTCFNEVMFQNEQEFSYKPNHCGEAVGGTYVPINLIYRLSTHTDIVPNGNSMEFCRSTVKILDLSRNGLHSQPIIRKMYILDRLDFSHNNIHDPLFFNYDNELENLRDIDFSYNNITTLEVFNDESNFFVELNKINLSYNNIIAIPLNFFIKFNDLNRLDLSFNKIFSITLDSFEGIANLKYLNLSFNKITDINMSLLRFTNLKELYLNNNEIASININNFVNLYQLEVLELSYNIISTLDNNVFDAMPLLTTVNLNNNRLKTFNRTLLPKANNLNKIDISYNNITYLSKNMFLRRKIYLFSIKGNNLTGALEKGLFDGLNMITVLDISHQSVTSLKEYSFFGLLRLSQLLLNDNFITFCATNSFLTLKNLQRLDLSNNKILKIDFVKSDLSSLKYFAVSNNLIDVIHVDDFVYLQNLQYLDLSQNNISRLQPKSFQTLSSLDNLLILKNPLRGSLEESTFDGLYSIPLLDLSGSSLTLIKNNSFNGMEHLYNLNISYGNITELQYNSFLNANNIEVIDLSYNQLSHFLVNTSHLKSLKDLRLSNNIIKSLPQDLLNGLLNLNKIILSHNDLSMLPDNIFQDQKYLNYLDLSYNTNLKIDMFVIKSCYKLETLILAGCSKSFSFAKTVEMPLTKLDISNCHINNFTNINVQKVKNVKVLLLDNNNITQIEFDQFSHLNYVEEIDISYNGIQFIEPGAFNDCHQLAALNMSHNYLSELKYGIFKGLAHLNVLDISYNILTDLETARFDELPNLSKLVVDHNKITEISVSDLRSTGLREISIGDNPLPCNSLIELIKYSVPEIVVKGIRYVESKDESYQGIGCNYYKHIPYRYSDRQAGPLKSNESISDRILIDIRDILINISSKNIENNDKTVNNNINEVEKSTKSLSEKMFLLNNITSLIEKESRSTNQYLERLLKLVAAINFFKPVSETKTSLKNDSNYVINKLKEEIENSVVIEKEKMLAEVSEKLLTINQRIDALISSTVHTPINEKLEFSDTYKSSVIIEICVVLILFILVCFILYKVYKSRFYILNRWSASTRHISDMENSNL